MKNKIWSIIALVAIVLISCILFGVYIGNTGLDINLYDTYFVITGAMAFMLLCFPIFLIALVWCLAKKIKNLMANVLCIIFTALLISLSTYLFHVVSGFESTTSNLKNELTIYPPLSALPNINKTDDSGVGIMNPFAHATTYILLFQLLLILWLIFLCFKTAKQYYLSAHDVS